MDFDMDDQVSNPKKLKHNEVVDVMGVDSNLYPSDVSSHEKAHAFSKGKSKVDYDDTWAHQIMDVSSCDHGISTSIAGSLDSIDHIKSSTPEPINLNNINSSNSDLSYHEDEICDDDGDYVDDNSDYANDDYLYEDDYLAIQSQFDNVDLPPGVEASLPWMKDPAPSAIVNAGTSNSSIAGLFESKGKDTVLGSAETKRTAESSFNEEVIDNEENGIMHKFKNFKQFDTVEDFSDHHYSRMGFSGQQPKSWAKRIQEEWKILEKDLPGGLRLNPNLYECGKVCLSLLGTWSGRQNEMWIPGTSTMLQVLVSIQALILNAKPFFNEPGYESSYVGAEGDRRSRKYSEDVFILSLKTMMYTLRRPPKYFEDYVIGHFHSRARDILVACKAYVDGATVGSVKVKDGVAEIDNEDRNASSEFKVTLRKMINVLITNFTRFGSIECEQFRLDD
ncbi:hypothetical protein MANES_12G089256v8 [Manihot esculenta]|uniref:Uncharacterized protein n=3 Tax=Manihot esculenta TaxID=3983 RepID=A0ACB7GQ19_MANES|nr:hypothetical protein MANES_12G089256v8 [Manihot esculenta]KAG8642467.1 hypothetical protein MANES_12G089256v8 [Manihot esculenta]KAG8642470.1 hypothetical protein MANES_12G089256v8 [Manihot esculenta]